MAQEIYRRKKQGDSTESQDSKSEQPSKHPLGKIPPPPTLNRPTLSPPAPGTPSQGQPSQNAPDQEVPAVAAPEARSSTPSVPLPAKPTPEEMAPNNAAANNIMSIAAPAAQQPTVTSPAAQPVATPVMPSVEMASMAQETDRLSYQEWQQRMEQLVEMVTVSDGKFEHRFRCETPTERLRAESLMHKEEGTIAWIDAEVQPGDVFYDIGANIGIYSLPAAQRVGNEGTVYAFEPHVSNAKSLLGNVAANQLQTRLKVISTPLSDVDGFEEFYYLSGDGGSSMSQLGERRDVMERPFEPCFSEWKLGMTVDSLVAAGALQAANVIKIDVDGNELKVLRGMQNLLTSETAPGSVQVEIHQRGRAEILEFMQSCGYQLADRHFTASGKQLLAAGHDPDAIVYLAIFRR